MPITKNTIDEIVNTRRRHAGINPVAKRTEEGWEGLLRFMGLHAPKGEIADDLFNEYEKQSGRVSPHILAHTKYDEHFKSCLAQVLTDNTRKNSQKDDVILSTAPEVIIHSTLQQTAKQIESICAIERKMFEAAEMLVEVAKHLKDKKPYVSKLIDEDFIRNTRLNYRLAELLVEYPGKKTDIYTALKNRLANSFIPDKEGAETNISCIISTLGGIFKMPASKQGR